MIIPYKSHRHLADDEKTQNLRKKTTSELRKEPSDTFHCAENAEFDFVEASLRAIKDILSERIGPPLFNHPTLFGMFMAQGDTAVTLNGCNSFCRIASHHVESDDPERWLEDHRVDGIGYGDDTAPHDRAVDGNIPMPSSIEELKAVRVFSDFKT